MEPGKTITPGQESPQTPAPQVELNNVNDPPGHEPIDTSEPETPESPVVEATDWKYSGQENDPTQAPERPASGTVKWTASEYIEHNKTSSWFGLALIVLVVAVAVIYLVTRDVLAAFMVAMAGIIFGVFSARSPRVLEYAVTAEGVQIGQKLYRYEELRSFAVNDDGPLPSILLIPLKRFLPPITVFYEPQTGDSIINVLASYLPFEHKQPDMVEKLMSHIRF